MARIPDAPIHLIKPLPPPAGQESEEVPQETPSRLKQKYSPPRTEQMDCRSAFLKMRRAIEDKEFKEEKIQPRIRREPPIEGKKIITVNIA